MADGFDPDKVWGPGNWVTHVCSGNNEPPHVATHSKAFHGRPLRAASAPHRVEEADQ